MNSEDCQECSGTGCEITFEGGVYSLEGDCTLCGGTGEATELETDDN